MNCILHGTEVKVTNITVCSARLLVRLLTVALLAILLLSSRAADAGDDVFEAAARLWDRGSYDSSEASLEAHFQKHGREVGAADVRSYALKASGMFGQVKNDRWSSGQPVPGETDNVRRFFRDERYIDIYKTGSGTKLIISFGKN